jgi:hypothetical protein
MGEFIRMKAIYLNFALLIVVCLYASPAFSQDSAPLVWEDAKTYQVLFTSNDIIAFDWEKQVFLLNLDAYLDFLAWVPPHMQLSRNLVVKDYEGIIYEGQWISMMSSIGYKGVAYDTYTESIKNANPFIYIRNGYPPNHYIQPGESDLRFAERLKKGLEKANCLRSFDPEKDYAEYLVKDQHDTWMDCESAMKIRIECYENTFRRGRLARAHVFIANAVSPTSEIDAIEIGVRLGKPTAADADWFTFTLAPQDWAKGVYICKFDLFAKGTSLESLLENGALSTRFQFRFLKKNGDSTTTLSTKEYPTLKIPIQPDVSGLSGDRWKNQ